MTHRRLVAFAAAGALAVVGYPALGQEEDARSIEEIVVTAQKRDESLQDVPLPITAFSEDYLEELGIKSLTELTQFAPSLRFINGNSIRNSSLAVRGIGSSGQNSGIDGSVGLYLDGIYVPRQAGLLNRLTDIQTVELLRGPQGTLYGVNTPSGLLAVNTRRPTEEFEGKVTAGVGNFGYREVAGYASGGISDTLAGRVSFWSSGLDGLDEMRTGGRTNGYDDYGARAKLLWEPSDDFELQATADYSRYDAVCCDGEWLDISDEALATWERMATNLGYDYDLYFPSRQGDGYMGRGERQDHVVYADGDGRETFEHWGVALRGIKDLASGHAIEFVVSHRRWDSDQKQENDEHGVDYSIFANQPEIQRSYDVEVRLSSPTEERLQYLVGAYAHIRNSDFTQQSQLLGPGCLYSRNTETAVSRGLVEDTPEGRANCVGWWRNDYWEQDTTSYAAFGQLSASVTDTLDLIAGARVTRDEKEAFKIVRRFGGDTPQNGLGRSFGTNSFDEEVSNTETTWALSARYLPDQGAAAGRFMAFARVAKGYKAPGINARPIRFPTIPTNFGPEESTNYEAGFKSTWLDRRILFNLTAFYSEFAELQQIVSNPAADPTGALGTFVQNAGELEHQGIEIEYEVLATDWLRVFGALAYLDSEFKEFEGTPCPAIGDVPRNALNPVLCDQTGLRNVNTPELRMNHTVEVTRPVTQTRSWFLRVSGLFTDDYYVTSDRDERGFQESHWIVNASTGLEGGSGRWRASLWVNNVGDEMWIRGLGNGAVPGNQGIRGSKVAYFGAQRTYGVEFTMTFD